MPYPDFLTALSWKPNKIICSRLPLGLKLGPVLGLMRAYPAS